MSLARRHLNFKFELGEGAFGEGNANTVEFTGQRASVTISKEGGVSMSNASVRIYGMPLEVMNKLTILGKPIYAGRRNTITISAGDDDSGMSVCFVGTIFEAWVDPNSAPAVSFVVSAFTGLVAQYKPVDPVSFNGSVDAALIMNGIAAQMVPPVPLENSGVSVQISNPYLAGTALDQMLAVARAGNFNVLLDNGTLAIWPKGEPRGSAMPLISAKTGMVGYPAHTQNGIQLTMLYNPSIVFGGALQVESILTPATGKWTVYKVTHDLESETPSGKWFTYAECNLFGHTTSIA